MPFNRDFVVKDDSSACADTFFYWCGEEVEGEAAEDDAHADALAQGDAFAEDEPSEDAGADGFAEDSHGDGGGGYPFEK